MKYILRRKFSAKGDPGGSPNWDSQCFFSVVFGKTSITEKTQMINTYIFPKRKKSNQLRTIRAQNHLITYIRLPIKAPLKALILTVFRI